MDFGATGPLERPEDVLARVRAHDARVTSIQADGRIHMDSPSGKGSAGVFVSVSRPARVYLEVQDFFGRPQATLTTDGERFGTFQAQEGVYYQGPASPANVSRLLPIQLSVQEMAGLLLGQVAIPDLPVKSMEVDERVRAYRIVLESHQVTQTVWIHPSLFRVLRSEVTGGAVVQFADFETNGSFSFPRKLDLQAPAEKTHVELSYRAGLKLNTPLEASLFDLTSPEGVPVVELDEWGARAGTGGQ